MAYSGVLDDIQACVDLRVPKRVPIFGITGEFDVKAAHITHPEYARNADAMVTCQTEMVKRFDYDWVFLIPDDYVEMEPLGIETQGDLHVPLTACEYLSASWETLDTLKLPDPKCDGRMPAFLDALGRIKETFGDTICLTGNVAGPFTSVGLLYGASETLTLLCDDPKLLMKSVEFFVDLQIDWAQAQLEAGADAIWLGDCFAGSAFISPEHYRAFAADGARTVCDRLKDAEAFVFYHAGENDIARLRLMAEVGPSALSVGELVDLEQAKNTIGKRMCLLGNIDGIRALERGSPADVERETARIMGIGKKGGGYIFNSGEGIPYQTPEENISTMMQTARKHARYR